MGGGGEKQETESPADQHTRTEQGQQEREQQQEVTGCREFEGLHTQPAVGGPAANFLHRRQHRKDLQQEEEDTAAAAAAGQGHGQASQVPWGALRGVEIVEEWGSEE